MREADRAMYRAKALGRDRTVVRQSPEAIAPLS
jgi:PleD family two-component response regulator